MPSFAIATDKRQQLIDVTQRVQRIVDESGVVDGLCMVFAAHATAAIVINENADPNICTDLLNALNKALPDSAGYLHDRIDGNAGAHIKAATLGPSETIPVMSGKLMLGTWQSIMLVELDGPRSERTVCVTVISNGR